MTCLRSDPSRQTRLETTGYAMFDRLGVTYRRQRIMFNRCCVDAYVPSARLVVQLDGDYWHGNPARYRAPDELHEGQTTYRPLDAAQQKIMANDRRQDAELVRRGYRVLRIWEADMYGRPDEVETRLLDALTSPNGPPAEAPART